MKFCVISWTHVVKWTKVFLFFLLITYICLIHPSPNPTIMFLHNWITTTNTFCQKSNLMDYVPMQHVSFMKEPLCFIWTGVLWKWLVLVVGSQKALLPLQWCVWVWFALGNLGTVVRFRERWWSVIDHCLIVSPRGLILILKTSRIRTTRWFCLKEIGPGAYMEHLACTYSSAFSSCLFMPQNVVKSVHADKTAVHFNNPYSKSIKHFLSMELIRGSVREPHCWALVTRRNWFSDVCLTA